ISQIVSDVMNDNSGRQIATVPQKEATKARSGGTDKKAKAAKPRSKPVKSLDEIVCPECGKGHLLRGRTAYGCSRYAEGCSLRLPFEQYPAELTPARLAGKLKRKK
ncbi:MAG: hypothetical protein K2M12_08740, partial [Muribaculaceae bacterium]|nr:hypothetical protein [Muribaculaceae bacterium]